VPPFKEAWVALEDSVTECQRGLGDLQRQIMEGSPNHTLDFQARSAEDGSALSAIRNDMADLRRALEERLAAEVAQREAAQENLWAALQGSNDARSSRQAAEQQAPEETCAGAAARPASGEAAVSVRDCWTSEAIDIRSCLQRAQSEWQAALADVQDRLSETSTKIAKVSTFTMEELDRKCAGYQEELEKLADQKADSNVVHDMLAEQKLDNVALEGRFLEERALRDQQHCALIDALEAMRSFMQDQVEGRGHKYMQDMRRNTEDEVTSLCSAMQENYSVERRMREGEIANIQETIKEMQGSLAWLCQSSPLSDGSQGTIVGYPVANNVSTRGHTDKAEDILGAVQKSLQAFETKLQEQQSTWAQTIHRQCQEVVSSAVEEVVARQRSQSNFASAIQPSASAMDTGTANPSTEGMQGSARTARSTEQIEGLLVREREVRQAQHDALQIQVQEVLTAQRDMVDANQESAAFAIFAERLDDMDRRLERAILATQEAVHSKTTRLWEAVSQHLHGSGFAFPQAPQRSARHTVKAPAGCASSLAATPTIPSPMSSPMLAQTGGRRSPPVPAVPLVATLHNQGPSISRAHSASSVRRQVSSPGILSHSTPRTPSVSRLQCGQAAPASPMVMLPRASSVPQRRGQACAVAGTPAPSSAGSAAAVLPRQLCGRSPALAFT